MSRVFVLLPVCALAAACAKDQGTSFVLVERLVGVLDLEYPQTDTSLDGTYSIEASSRMDFDAEGVGTWEIRYVSDDRGAVTEEVDLLDLVSYRISNGSWLLVADGEPNLHCDRDDVGLDCVDIAYVESRWVEE